MLLSMLLLLPISENDRSKINIFALKSSQAISRVDVVELKINVGF
jgi:hypothetical protein